MIDDSLPIHNANNDLPINADNNNPPHPINPNAPPAPMQDGGEVRNSLKLEPSKIAKGILKSLNNNRSLIVSGLGVGVMALGAGLMISFAFVPSVGIGLVIGGAFLAVAGVSVAVLAQLLDPVVDKGIDKAIQGSKIAMDAIRGNPKLADIRDKFNHYASTCCGRLDSALDDFKDYIHRRGVNHAEA